MSTTACAVPAGFAVKEVCALFTGERACVVSRVRAMGLCEGLAFGMHHNVLMWIKKNDGLMEAITAACPAKHFPFSGGR
jgi:hypothetical protein